MVAVVVVGAGLGGLATAARLAKLGHRVTVCERASTPGGLLLHVRRDGYGWDAKPFQTTVPAVLRDLFRKSGRPLERYVDLVPSTPARRHVFPDGTVLDLPTGSRGAQLTAVSAALGVSAGAAWTGFVDEQSDVWDRLRRDVLEPPASPARLADRRTRRDLRTRRSLHHLLRKALRDERLRLLAGYPTLGSGRDVADEPAFAGVHSYVERTFGVWRLAGGADDLTRALLRRMSERSVDVRFDSDVVSVHTDGDRVAGVGLRNGTTLDAPLVVTAIAPHRVFGRLDDERRGGLLNHELARSAAGLVTPPPDVRLPTVVHFGLAAPSLDLAGPAVEVVLHGDPLIVVCRGGAAPPGSSAWTVTLHGSASVDVLDLLAGRGLDLRDAVTTQVEAAGGSGSCPLRWQGARTAAARAAIAHPLAGLHCLGTDLILGASVPYVAWQAAHVAELVGKA